MAFTVADLRKLVQYNARQAKDSSEYVTEQIDFALQRALREWVRITKCTRQLDALTLTVGSAALPSLPSGFLPEFLLQAYLTISGQQIKPDLTVVGYQQLLELQYGGVSGSGTIVPGNGRPCVLAFYNRTNGVVGPLPPDQAYVVNLWWAAPPSSWTAGGAGPTPFNLDDDALEQCAIGASGYLQVSEPEGMAFAKERIGEFQAAAKQFAARGHGSRGEQVIYRDPPDWQRGGCR